ncbi:amino acid permease [Halanaerobaculum tunisiense]
MADDNHKVDHPLIREQAKPKTEDQVEENLNLGELVMVGLGATIGAGFFLASSIAIRLSGPAIILNFLVSAFIMWQVFSALAEMSVAVPDTGSFQSYANQALGEMYGFVSGWMYWIAGVLVMSSEVTASAIFTQWWFADIPLWVFAFIYSLMIIGVNSLGVKNFGQIESVFSIVKIGALISFILLGLSILTGVFSVSDKLGIENYFIHGGFFANGLQGFLAASLMSLVSFGGVVVTGMATSETVNSDRTVPSAIKIIVLTLVTLYVFSLLILLAIVPWNQISQEASPFVELFRLVDISYAGSIINFVILTAALSTMNAAMYAVTRVLFSIAQNDQAPEYLTVKNKRGVPIYALLVSSLGLGLAVLLSYLLPEKVYEYVTSAAAFILFFNWIIILISQLRYRPRLQETGQLKFKMKGYPYTSWLTIGLLIMILGSSVLVFHQLVGLIVGLVVISGLFVIYNLLDN